MNFCANIQSIVRKKQQQILTAQTQREIIMQTEHKLYQ